MLTRISISNYAIITNTEITFNEGFSVLTGETGAGKSILLNALNMILGERLDLKQISNREKKSIVEAEFDISKYNLKGLFESNDIDFDNTCILRREVSTAGKSRAFINASVMKEISSRLIDIHSQHNNLLLFNQSYQLSLIDGIAKNSEIRAKYSNAYNEFLKSEKRLKQQIAAVEQAKRMKIISDSFSTNWHHWLFNLEKKKHLNRNKKALKMSKKSSECFGLRPIY